ncbi:helix-turn-helix transcriptional regulator [Providencia stuartii]|nr:helix-turn-helix transcriptional regulator [Providencia stuartii]MDN0005299.1 helix-turn-helix transcriptional regulator [Providencia stuartii]
MQSNLSPKEIVGSNIHKARRAKGLSGSELADLLLCSQQHVSRIERGVIRLHL